MIVAVICDVLGEENNGTTIGAMNLIRTPAGQGPSGAGGQPRCQPGRGSRGITWSPLEIWGFSTTMWQKRLIYRFFYWRLYQYCTLCALSHPVYLRLV